MTDAPSAAPVPVPVAKTPKGASTRRRIVDAAIELFAAQGYHATTINEIGLRAGVQRGALYHHIKAKEDLLHEVLTQHVEAVLEAAQAIVDADLAPAEKLDRLLRTHARTLLERGGELAIYDRDARALTGARRTDLRARQAEVERLWVRIFQEGVQAHTLRALDPVAIKALIGMVNALHHWFRPDGRLGAEEIAQIISDVVLRGVLVVPAEARLSRVGRRTP
ncbi:MAG TPA: TetR/AcrR family transcriptional regulator [Solirubrobacteraceae bacterium]|jgi:AcrR family transcriptional regulator|nr:TetR/AcrR family transcriptional regulator [Solirubrobacteraceae bacterium]